jgi:hypothetical protein
MCKITRMKFPNSLRILSLTLLFVWLVLPSVAAAAENERDPQTVLNGMRLKKWTKDLTLTADQQKKVQALLDEEGKAVSKVIEDETVAINDRRTKVSQLREATYAKIKPILTASQLEVFEKSLARTKPKKN